MMGIKGFTDIGGGRKAISVDHDPTSVATDVPKGSLIIDANGEVYRKVDDGATTNVIHVAGHKCNDAATVAPTVDDDVDLGYGVGSVWCDITADKAYVCLDPTDGAAVWTEITQGSGGGESYVDRGDPSAVDASIGSGLTADGTWRSLSLSSIVPAGAASKLVHLRCRILDNSVESVMQLRKVGNTNAVNATKAATAVTNDSRYFDAWIMLDSARAVEYNIDSGMNNAEVTVAGWMV